MPAQPAARAMAARRPTSSPMSSTHCVAIPTSARSADERLVSTVTPKTPTLPRAPATAAASMADPPAQ